MKHFVNSEFGKVYSEKIKTIYFALFLLAACFMTGARAQNTSAQSPSNRAAAANALPIASPTPIPFSDVIAQAEDASSTLKKISAVASADATTETVEHGLPLLIDEINARINETAQIIESSASLPRLLKFESDWRTLTNDLPKWRENLTDSAKRLEADLKRIDDLSEKWQQTLGELQNTETPPEVLARVDEIIRTAGDTRLQIIARQTRLVALQNRVAEQQTRVDESIKTIAARREELVGQLFVQDNPPVWNVDFWTRETDIAQAVRESLAAQFDALKAFAGRNKDKIIIHILVFFLLAAFLFFLRRWASPLVEANPDLRQSAVIFYLPVSTALVVAILFNSRIYPQTPQILGAIFGAVVLVPTVVILRKLLDRILYPLLYSLVIFYAIDQIRAIFEGIRVLVRPLFLAEMLGAFLFFLWLYRNRLRKEPSEDVKYGRVFLTIRAAALVALPFFAVAFLANVFGYVGLSRFVGSAVLRSAYAAVVLYAVVRIIDGLIDFALRFRPLNLLKMARNFAPTIQEKARKFIRFIAFVLWLLATLEVFTVRQTVFEQVRAILTAELNIGSLSFSAFDVLLFFFVVWTAFLLSRFIRFTLEEDVFPRFSLAQGTPYAISTIINYVILLIGFLVAVGAARFDLTKITVLIGAFGVGIGFGLQNIFNNFVSGLILLFERPVKVGDEIKLVNTQNSGIVKSIGIRASRIRLWDNSEIIVPNSHLISENVKSWSLSARKRGIEIPVSVAHDTDPDLVIKLLTEAARAHPLITKKPAPQILLSEIISPTLNIRLRAWTAQGDQAIQITSDLTAAISQKLAENNIEVPQVPTNAVS